MPIDPQDPTRWPAETIVVRCGSSQGVLQLSERLSRDATWSVFTGPGISFHELARSCRNNQVRQTTVGVILRLGGHLRASSGPPHHHDLWGLTAQQLDDILSEPEPNPVPKHNRWMP